MQRTAQHRSFARFGAWGWLGFFCLLASGAAAQDVVGGIAPSIRPDKAPRLTQVAHDQAWYRRALTGVSKPYPQSLLFLDHQGDWYTPFTRRGAPGPYDIRRMHEPAR